MKPALKREKTSSAVAIFYLVLRAFRAEGLSRSRASLINGIGSSRTFALRLRGDFELLRLLKDNVGKMRRCLSRDAHSHSVVGRKRGDIVTTVGQVP